MEVSDLTLTLTAPDFPLIPIADHTGAADRTLPNSHRIIRSDICGMRCIDRVYISDFCAFMIVLVIEYYVII